MAYKNFRIEGKYTPLRSITWRQINSEEPIVVLVCNSFVGDRKPEVYIWVEVKYRPPTPYILYGKAFKTKKKAIDFARDWIQKNDNKNRLNKWLEKVKNESKRTDKKTAANRKG